MGDNNTALTLEQLRPVFRQEALAAFSEWAKNNAPGTPHPKADMDQGGGPASVSEQKGKVAAAVDGKPVNAELISARQGVAGLLDNDVRVPFLNIALPAPLAAVAGTGLGVALGNVIDDKIKNTGINIAAHLAAAGLEYSLGRKYVGNTTAMFMAGSHIVRLALRYTPAKSWFETLESALSKAIPSMGQDLEVHQTGAMAPQPDVQQAAEQAAARNHPGWSNPGGPAYASLGAGLAY